jgi:hypothetical protein
MIYYTHHRNSNDLHCVFADVHSEYSGEEKRKNIMKKKEFGSKL